MHLQCSYLNYHNAIQICLRFQRKRCIIKWRKRCIIKWHYFVRKWNSSKQCQYRMYCELSQLEWSTRNLDNRVTIYHSSRVNWKHFCSSSPEPFCGSISNEGPYKCSILLPLLLLLLLLVLLLLLPLLLLLLIKFGYQNCHLRHLWILL